MFSSLSGGRSGQADSAVQRFQNLPQAKQGEHGDQILCFPKPMGVKIGIYLTGGLSVRQNT